MHADSLEFRVEVGRRQEAQEPWEGDAHDLCLQTQPPRSVGDWLPLGLWLWKLSPLLHFDIPSFLIGHKYSTLLVFSQERQSLEVMRGLPCLSLLECDLIPSPGRSLH